VARGRELDSAERRACGRLKLPRRCLRHRKLEVGPRVVLLKSCGLEERLGCLGVALALAVNVGTRNRIQEGGRRRRRDRIRNGVRLRHFRGVKEFAKEGKKVL
jgi:hypothetical protein